MHPRARTFRAARLLAALSGALLVGTAAPSAHAATAREDQWHLDAMHADEMWKTSTGKGITVAVIDSGVDPDIPDLRGQVLPGKNFSRIKGDEHTDYDGHGTGMSVLIAGTGAAGPEKGTYGLAPGAKILPIRVPDFLERSWPQGGGNPDSYPTYVAKAIRYAADSDARIINISLGKEETSKRLEDAVAYAQSKGKLIFASAGNTGSGTNALEYPSSLPGVVGVGAIGKDLNKTKESQSGPQVDLVAPGADIVAACLRKTGVCISHGTSDASALASASAALIWSKHPTWTNNQVLRVLVNTASGPVSGKKRTDEIGYGAVRPRIALTNPGDPGPADEYPLPDLAKADAPPQKSAPSKETPAAAGSTGGGSSSLPWILGGAGALVVLGGGTATALALRARRRRAVAAPPPPPPYPAQWPPHPGVTPAAAPPPPQGPRPPGA